MSDNPALFRLCLAASLCLHCGLFLFGRSSSRSFSRPLPPIEVDLDMPVLGGGGGAPAKLGAPQKAPPAVVPMPPPETKPLQEAAPPAQPPKEWVTPTEQVTKTEPPPPPPPAAGGTPDGKGTALKPGGSGPGSDTGVPGGTGAGLGTGGPPGGVGSGSIQPPRLLNREEMLLNLLRFYPESERRANREGQVVLVLHIGVDGSVAPGEVLSSAGAAFDAAAREVAKLMRFAPARNSLGPVPVKLRQPIQFRLQD